MSQMKWVCGVMLLLFGAVASEEYELDEAEYHKLPRLFAMDEYDACLASGHTYCLGSFLLRPRTEHAHTMFDGMLKYSSGAHHFNHSLIHRGRCLSHCPHGSSPRSRFQHCVSDQILNTHGFDTKLLKLDYCEHAKSYNKPYDGVDVLVAWVVGLVLVCNLAGTIYDLMRSVDGKPNKYLMAWSIRENWRRLFATYENGDPRLAALKSVQGIRAFTMALVLLAHSMIVHHMVYIQNPEIIERNGSHWLSTIFHNGSVIVQTFFMLSSFLFAYNLLLLADTKKMKLSLCMLPKCLMHRVVRIVPLYLMVVGLTATWWSRSSSGALWSPLVRAHASACRRAWWTHALFLNNAIYPDNKCLMQSWFLAADMQLYVVAAALTLTLARCRQAVVILAAAILASVAANFVLAYTFDLKPIMMIMNPEVIRAQYVGNPSFNYLYAAPWGSLPASLLGVLLAFLQRDLQRRGYSPEHSTISDFLSEEKYMQVFRLAYSLFFPALVLWVVGGHLVRTAPPVAVAVYAAVDRFGFVLIGAVGLIGFFNGVDSVWKRFFEWGGWRPLGRMSLAALLLHWNHNLTHLALRSQPSRVAVYEIGGHWHSVHFMTYVTAIPLHILVEQPAQRFLQALLF